MKNLLFIVLITAFAPSVAFSQISDWTENFESIEGVTLGCGSGCGRSAGEVPYSFSSAAFRCIVNSDYWDTSTHQTSGGVNNSAYFRAVVPTPACPASGSDNDAYLMLRSHSSGGTGWNDASFYIRHARKFSSGWATGSYPELKLWYHYPNPAGMVSESTMFWAADYTGEDLLRLFLTHPNLYVTHNGNNTNASHNYRFRISQHFDKWFSMVYWFDWSTTTHRYKLWITTEDGATNCSAGTVCTVNGVYEYNEFLYIDTQFAGQPAYTSQRIDLGFFLNTAGPVAAGATTGFDSFAASETQLTSNVFTGSTPAVPRTVTGVQIHGGGVR